MHRKLTITSIVFGFVGAFLAFLDARRTAYGFEGGGVRLGLGADYYTWFWRHCGQIGFLCLVVAFGLEFVAVKFYQTDHHNKGRDTKGSDSGETHRTMPDLPHTETTEATKEKD
jgi:hypothetical protein